MRTSITQVLAVAFLTFPIIHASELPASSNLERRYVGSNAVMASIIARNPDLLPSRDLTLARHAELEIAARANTAKNIRGLDSKVEAREPHHKSTRSLPMEIRLDDMVFASN